MADELEQRLTRPIIGIDYRSGQEAFDIMCDRIRSAFASEVFQPAQSAEGMRLLKNLVDVYDGMQNSDGEPCPDVAAAQRFLARRLPTSAQSGEATNAGR